MKIRNVYRHCYGTASIDKMLPSIITKSIWDFFKTQILIRNNSLSFSQEDSFLKEREVSRWEMNWLRTRDGRKPS
ncbi:hypothetical protein [Bacillus cereus]|uniref:hypothetical protein n=1 Tax=Bacillus cereus TaxID=1396 RepID=UPI0024BCAB90|nr:hypothetical protein [Bacillus cereus]